MHNLSVVVFFLLLAWRRIQINFVKWSMLSINYFELLSIIQYTISIMYAIVFSVPDKIWSIIEWNNCCHFLMNTSSVMRLFKHFNASVIFNVQQCMRPKTRTESVECVYSRHTHTHTLIIVIIIMILYTYAFIVINDAIRICVLFMSISCVALSCIVKCSKYISPLYRLSVFLPLHHYYCYYLNEQRTY